MNIFEGRWSKFKQELPSIIFLSIIQIWCVFNFPLFIRLGSPWSVIFSVFVSVISVIVCIYMFSFSDKYALLINLDYLNNAPYGHILKNITRIWFITIAMIAHVVMFVVWYKDFYHMPSIYYAIAYIYCVMFFVLLFRAAKRNH